MNDVNINWQPSSLQDELVKLVPLTENDFDSLYAVASDPLIWEQHPSSDRYQKPVFQEFFKGALDSKAAFLIIDKSTDKVIGSTRYYDYKENESIAIGFTFLARQYWGGRYNKSVKELMINYAFQYVDKIIFHIGASNLRSQMATMRFGAVKTGEFYTEDQNGRRLSYEYTLEK
jgi:RimJ/RimL family protein N-acetyltransferase